MTNTARGLMWAGGTALISGVSIFVNSLLVQGMDPLVHTTVKNLLVALVVAGVLVISGRWQGFRKLTGKQWWRLLGVGVIGGSIPFALFFTGLKEIGGPQGALIHKTLIFWVALLAVPLLQEKISTKMATGLVLLYAANFLAGFTGFGGWSIYHVMVMGATLLWAVENVIAKKVLKDVAADVVVFSRMAMGWPILAGILLASGRAELVTSLTWQQWVAQGASALLLTGYVMTWYRALKWAPATQVATILTGGVVVTSVLQAVFVTGTYSLVQLGQALFIVTGIWLVLTQVLDRFTANETRVKQRRLFA